MPGFFDDLLRALIDNGITTPAVPIGSPGRFDVAFPTSEQQLATQRILNNREISNTSNELIDAQRGRGWPRQRGIDNTALPQPQLIDVSNAREMEMEDILLRLLGIDTIRQRGYNPLGR